MDWSFLIEILLSCYIHWNWFFLNLNYRKKKKKKIHSYIWRLLYRVYCHVTSSSPATATKIISQFHQVTFGFVDHLFGFSVVEVFPAFFCKFISFSALFIISAVLAKEQFLPETKTNRFRRLFTNVAILSI